MKKFLKGALFVITAFSLLAISCCDNGGSSGSSSSSSGSVVFSAEQKTVSSDVFDGITPVSAVSSNTKVVTVSVSSGKVIVTSVGEGAAVITVTGTSASSDILSLLFDDTSSTGSTSGTSGGDTGTGSSSTATSGSDTETGSSSTASSGSDTGAGSSSTATSGSDTGTTSSSTATSGSDTGTATSSTATSGSDTETTTAATTATTATTVEKKFSVFALPSGKIIVGSKKYKSTNATWKGQGFPDSTTYETLELIDDKTFKIYDSDDYAFDGKGSYAISGTSIVLTLDGSWGHITSGKMTGTVSSDGKTVTVSGTCTNKWNETGVLAGTFTLME